MPNLPILLCISAVSRAWRAAMQSKVRDRKIIDALGADLQSLMLLNDVPPEAGTDDRALLEYVEMSIEATLQKYDAIAPAFIAYFRTHWLPRESKAL